MKILFVCKYNRFRSRVAEAYFKKINKNKNISAESGGIIKGFLPLYENEVKVAKEFGIDILGVPRGISVDQLNEQDKIIIVANDVPKEIFDFKTYKDKIEKWEIEDNGTSSEEKPRKIIKQIIKNVDNLVKGLK